ncbi:endonuclease [Priestia megaterium]|uniref:endonuclease n=1 Tax=Priestia megaterium TaxID=1404 RepID=UPI0013E3CF3A|nr:endonuclease [Priestia megaterium]MED3865293.1 endonuclease [Priestia megaterium]MED4102944.1 endonuclease [Priestia megaterium]MED4146500.1 endonuclease [Priestia megaterium]MED4168749.1 endonuclease [Priestia megaterium]MED4201600.1 endonuclease [Priestia megaterium]
MKLYALCKKTWAMSLLIFALLVSLTPVSQAAEFLSVAQALENQNNTVQTVKGYVVGQPTGTSTVITSNYPNDYALALADSANETNTDKMVYVQIPSNLRSTFGLQSHSELKGKILTVKGTLTPYFSHPGIKSVTSISTETGGTDPTPDPTEPTVPVEDYYRTAAGKTGNTLKTELHNIIDHHTELSYSAVWEALKKTDEDPANANNVILLYTGRSQAKSTNGGGVDDWNREHVWAKSHGDFGTAMGPGTDLHHLRPTDVSVNSTRGNLDFDNGGTEHSEALGNYFDSDSWEPRDEVKGDVARMLFYMAVRYEGDVSDEPDLELNNTVNNGTAPYHGKISVLLQWNAQDPVDDRERRRNDIIYSDYQHNRNPFIDHPEWVNEIWN